MKEELDKRIQEKLDKGIEKELDKKIIKLEKKAALEKNAAPDIKPIVYEDPQVRPNNKALPNE